MKIWIFLVLGFMIMVVVLIVGSGVINDGKMNECKIKYNSISKGFNKIGFIDCCKAKGFHPAKCLGEAGNS